MNKEYAAPVSSFLLDPQALDDDCISMISASSFHSRTGSISRPTLEDDDFECDDEENGNDEDETDRWMPPFCRTSREEAPKRPHRRVSDRTLVTLTADEGDPEGIEPGDTIATSSRADNPLAAAELGKPKIPQRRPSIFDEWMPSASSSLVNSMSLECGAALPKISGHKAVPRIPRRRIHASMPQAQELSSVLAATVNARISTLSSSTLPTRSSRSNQNRNANNQASMAAYIASSTRPLVLEAHHQELDTDRHSHSPNMPRRRPSVIAGTSGSAMRDPEHHSI